jgi:Zn finger protein HypA/HybF involved in hydrogenase expression
MEWCQKRNKELTPYHVSEFSSRKVWWKCEHGHYWKATVSNRSCGTGCPYCASKIVDTGVNDLKTLRPDLAKQWDKSKNGDLTAEMVTLGSNRKVWWICEHCHSYCAPVVARVYGKGCPYCAHKLPIIGETDFATIHPELISEWDDAKNLGKLPQHYTYGSKKRVWWKCKHGHSWKTSICNRHRGSRCPYCYGVLAVPFETDAATITPHLAKEWAADKNEGIDIRDVLPFSNIKYWWKCKGCDQYWQSTVGARTQGSMCPRCFGKAVYRPRLA